MQVYAQGSKKAANEALARGEDIAVTEYSIHGERSFWLKQFADDRTTIKFWTKRDPWQNPIAKSYGVWNKVKGRVE